MIYYPFMSYIPKLSFIIKIMISIYNMRIDYISISTQSIYGFKYYLECITNMIFIRIHFLTCPKFTFLYLKNYITS